MGGAIGGGCQAVIAGFGLAGAAAVGVPVKALDFQQIGMVFLSGAFINTILFLKQSPIPPENGDTVFIEKTDVK